MAGVIEHDSPSGDPQRDEFQRYPVAERVARAIAERSDAKSIVVAIHGKWGEGKTTFLEYIHEALCRPDDVFSNIIPVRFNPWRLTDENELLISFFATVADALDESPKTHTEKIGAAVRELGYKYT